MHSLMEREIIVGARNSTLSKVQVAEVWRELAEHCPDVSFYPVFCYTRGDRELNISLRTMGKTDFFTKEIDDMLIEGRCRVAVHSAKDLPDPLPKGISIAAVTKGLNPADALVMRESDTLDNLRPGSRIATSSERREQVVRAIRDDLIFIDLRGTVEDRLKKLDNGQADGVVVAEAALIRLQLTHLNRLILPGETVQGQGQLAILAQEDDHEMHRIFSCIDSRVETAFEALA